MQMGGGFTPSPLRPPAFLKPVLLMMKNHVMAEFAVRDGKRGLQFIRLA